MVLSTAPQPPQVLLMTSSTAGEGKTVTSLNLAIALAQRGEPTLLIDADLRHPSIGKALNLVNGTGLATYLTGSARHRDGAARFPSRSHALGASRRPHASQSGATALLRGHGILASRFAQALQVRGD